MDADCLPAVGGVRHGIRQTRRAMNHGLEKSNEEEGGR